MFLLHDTEFNNPICMSLSDDPSNSSRAIITKIFVSKIDMIE